jgi:hypothetical protein
MRLTSKYPTIAGDTGHVAFVFLGGRRLTLIILGLECLVISKAVLAKAGAGRVAGDRAQL